VPALRRAAQAAGLAVELVHGVSFVEPCLAALDLDALDGLYVGDALALGSAHHPPFGPDQPALIGQLYSRELAADVKLTLLNQYPPEHPVFLLRAAGTYRAQVQPITLVELDRQPAIDALTALCVPPLRPAASFEALQETVAHLRAPEGCPWDRQQTHQSLRSHLLEETYEALSAIDADDPSGLREELGDLLLQIVLQAQIATEGGDFSMAEVIAGIQSKLIRRHPHVFGDLQVSEVDQVLRNWEHLKQEERGDRGGAGLLDGVPSTLPALAQAAELQRRAAAIGFDWPALEGVLEKLAEEVGEVARAEDAGDRGREIGDTLFALVNVVRWMGLDPEAELRLANQRFRARFQRMSELAEQRGAVLGEMTVEQMDGLWEQAKREAGDS
jgi:tetrapyrrole methylase family protein/MazG family protein